MLAALVVALVGGELVARSVTAEVYLQRWPEEGGILVPFEPGGRAELVMDEFRSLYEINRFGYRDRLDRTLEKPPGSRRLLLLGDSFSAGWGVEFEETFGALLERRTSVEVVNTARNGGCPHWYVFQHRWAAPRFDVDGVIVQLFDNDPAECRISVRALGLEPGVPVGELPARYLPRTGLAAALGRGLRHLVLAQHARNLWRSKARGAEVGRQPWVRIGAFPERVPLDPDQDVARNGAWLLRPVQMGAGRFGFHNPEVAPQFADAFELERAMLEQLVDEVRERGSRIAIVYIPAHVLVKSGRSPREMIEDNPHARLLRELCAERDVPLLDMTAVMLARPDPIRHYHLRDGHYNARGHAAVAEALEPLLRAEWPDLFE
jgi:lysophospholipase L1-like esterase